MPETSGGLVQGGLCWYWKRWFFTKENGSCGKVQYWGCGPNIGFESEDDCLKTCLKDDSENELCNKAIG